MTAAKIRLGVIGNGNAATLVLENAEASGYFDFVGAVDTEPRARARFEQRFGAPAYDNVDELIDQVPLDGVYIATPTKLHEAQTLACLDAGINVLVEKPISTSLDAAQRMILKANEQSLTLMVCHKRSVDRSIISMFKIIKSGELGRVRAVHRWHYTDWFYRPRGIDERDPETGGVVLRQGAHEFDVIRLLAGTPARSLHGVTGNFDSTREGEGWYASWINHDDGVMATSIYGGYGHFLSDEFTAGIGNGRKVGAAKGVLTNSASTPELEAELKRVVADMAVAGPSSGVYGFTLVNLEGGDLRPSPTGGAYVYSDNGRREITVEGIDGTGVIVEEFYRAVADQQAVLHDGDWGLACLEQCLAIRTSGETGELVPLTQQGSVNDEAAMEFLGGHKVIEIIGS